MLKAQPQLAPLPPAGPSASKSADWYDSRMQFDDGAEAGGESPIASGDSSQSPLEPEDYEGGDAYHLTAKRPQNDRRSEFCAVDDYARSALPPSLRRSRDY